MQAEQQSGAMPDRYTVIAMAGKAGMFTLTDEYSYHAAMSGDTRVLRVFERFAALVAAQEREQCALAIQSLPAFHPENDGWGDEGGFAIMEPCEPGDEQWVEKNAAAAAIRSMGKRT